MKFITLIFILFNASTFYFMNRSTEMLSQIESSIKSTEYSYSALMDTNNIQRSSSLATVGFSLDEEKFLNESSSLLKNNQSDFKKHLSALRLKKQAGKDISRKDLIYLTMLAERHYLKSMENKESSWDKANEDFRSIILSYKSNQKVTQYMQVFSLLSLIFIVLIAISREKVKTKLKEKDRLHSQLFSSLLEGVFLCNNKGIIVACNSSGALVAGHELRNLVGKNIGNLFSNMDIRSENQKRIDSKKYFGEIIKKKNIIFGKTIAVTGKKGYTNWYNLNAQPFTSISDNDSTMLLSFSNVTEKIHAQNTIKLQQIELMEGSKLRTIGEMAGGIAHEIDNPLATIYATTERLGFKAERGSEVKSEVILKSTEKTLKTVKRITSVVKSLLSLSREADAEVQFLQVQDVLDLAMDLAQIELIRTKIDFSLESETLDTVIECYPTQIAQVLLNLTKNSIDAIEAKSEKWIHLKVSDEGDFMRFTFADSGKGIIKEVADKVLLPFFSTKEASKGTGLGLSISRSIIASHGGEIFIDMDAPTTTFIFTIPKKYPKEEDQEIKVAS